VRARFCRAFSGVILAPRLAIGALMQTRHVVLLFVWMASAATFALADTAKSIRVAPHVRDPLATLAMAGAETPSEPKYQLTVAAAREESLSTLYPRLESLKSEFYAAYNQANDDPRYEVRCKRGEVQLEANTVVLGRVCSPKLKVTCSEGSIQQLCTAWPPEGFCEHLLELVARHPELRELLEKYDALAEHYAEVRGEKLKDRIPNDSACGPRRSLPR
jgi:hypothetical protein